MSTYRSALLHTLSERGFIQDISDPEELDNLALKSKVTAYIGFDCTAQSLHVGSLLPIMMLRWMQETGNYPIALVGGGTTRVGDPSGKDEGRKFLSDEIIEQNLKSIKVTLDSFLTFQNEGGNALLVNNADWLNSLNYIDFLREVGRHFSVNRMLSFDSVKLRLERQQELSFLEFNYMILQAYDFVQLRERYDCALQMGGSDQWGNIINGIELGRRMYRQRLFGLTAPLITTSSGTKMGKTAAGAVWLDPTLTTQYEFWQYWRNTDDRDVARFLKLFTMLPISEIDRLASLRDREINHAKTKLATEVTALVHGREAAEGIERSARQTFERGGYGIDLPTLTITPAEIEAGFGLALANTRLGFTSSNAQARELVKSGAVRIGDRRITDPHYKFRPNDFDESGRLLLSNGSRKKAIVTLRSE